MWTSMNPSDTVWYMLVRTQNGVLNDRDFYAKGKPVARIFLAQPWYRLFIYLFSPADEEQ